MRACFLALIWATQLSVKKLHFCSYFGAKSTKIRILQDRLQVKSSQKLYKSTVSKFQQYLRQFSLYMAPVPFLYSQELLLYDLSNTGKDFMDTLYVPAYGDVL
jgi:hypothetical protein